MASNNRNYFSGSKDYPHHISVGAILLNDEGKVACHYYEEQIRKYPSKFHTLMHESIELNETLEEALHRGLDEEFSAKAKIREYVGSLVINYNVEDSSIEKTVLYFLCDLVSITDERDLTDPENQSEIKWMDIDKLVEIMKEQGKEHGLPADESKILLDIKNNFL
jgi:hypothetical protein